jgi:hypothetical protein
MPSKANNPYGRANPKPFRVPGLALASRFNGVVSDPITNTRLPLWAPALAIARNCTMWH